LAQTSDRPASAGPAHQLNGDGPTSLDALFAPRSVAVVGASDDPKRIGGRPIAYLKERFQGRILPVSQSRAVVQGLPAVPQVTDLEAPPDLAIIAVPARHVVGIARECADFGVRSLLVFTSGFAEASSEGARWQRDLVAVGQAGGMRICGPNCIGQINLPDGAVTTFGSLPDLPAVHGSIGLASQSGAYGLTLFKFARSVDLPIAHVLSTGNECDVDVTDALAWLVQRPEVDVLVGFAEAIREPTRLLDVARRARELDKPFLFLKAGTSVAGARAALSHTGSVVGADDVIDAVFRQHGILRPRSSTDIITWSRLLMARRRARGPRVGIVTTSGGVGVLMSDAAEAAGLETPPLPAKDQESLAALLPPFGSPVNPVDCTGQVVNNPGFFAGVLRTVAASADIDLVAVAGLPDTVEPGRLSALTELAAATDKPLVAWAHSRPWVSALAPLGIAVYDDPVAAMRAAGALVSYSAWQPPVAHICEENGERATLARAVLQQAAGGAALLDSEATAVLAAYGIPLAPAMTAADLSAAREAARGLGFPLALKVVSPDVLHKSDVGGVRLGIRDEADLATAYESILAEVKASRSDVRILGVLVQKMAAPGLELVCGMKRDAQFGPIVAVGLGGVLVEILRETVLRQAPLSWRDALSAVAEIGQGRLLHSERGLRAAAAEAVASLLVSLGQLAADLPEITEIDLNPVIVNGAGPLVVDALMTLTPDHREEGHLVR
jgi:acetate---CoA ligase (ADP-forming)